MAEEDLLAAYEDARLSKDEDAMMALAIELYEEYGKTAR